MWWWLLSVFIARWTLRNQRSEDIFTTTIPLYRSFFSFRLSIHCGLLIHNYALAKVSSEGKCRVGVACGAGVTAGTPVQQDKEGAAAIAPVDGFFIFFSFFFSFSFFV